MNFCTVISLVTQYNFTNLQIAAGILTLTVFVICMGTHSAIFIPKYKHFLYIINTKPTQLVMYSLVNYECPAI